MSRPSDPFADSAFTEGVALGVLVTLVLMAGLAYLLVRFEDMTPLYRHGHAVGYTAALDSLEELAMAPAVTDTIYLSRAGTYYWVGPVDSNAVMDSNFRPHGGW